MVKGYEEGIKQAMFSLEDYKALDLDGFEAFF